MRVDDCRGHFIHLFLVRLSFCDPLGSRFQISCALVKHVWISKFSLTLSRRVSNNGEIRHKPEADKPQ